MKIENKKMFMRGIILLLLSIIIVVCRFLIFTDTHSLPIRAVIMAGICLVAAIYHLVVSLHIEGEDDETEGE